MLITLVALLVVAVVAVTLTRRAGFGSILGYLVGGAIIGPSGLKIVSDVGEIREISELGVIMLLFLIGLELRPARLWVMRRTVFGVGTSQLVVTTALLAALAHVAGVPWAGAVVLGTGLSLSSTAIVLPMLAERDLLGATAGRDSFAVLLFQDLAFIPLVALVPLLAGDTMPKGVPWIEVVKGGAGIAAILIGGRFLLRPAFRAIGGARTPEVFTALALLTVAGTAALAEAAGLSMSLGGFLAGLLLSDSEYRHELQADIEPFEGLLLGFFFMSVGMAANLGLAVSEPALIASGVVVLLAGKAIVAGLIARIAKRTTATAARFGLSLSQGSEFSFVLFGVAVGAGVLSQQASDRATLIVALSMAATPVLFAASERFLVPALRGNRPEPVYDAIDGASAPVIICGFGRVGQIVGRLLKLRGIEFTALEKDPGQVEVVRKFGTKIYYGNPARPDVLRAAGAETARLLVVALSEVEENLQVVDMVHRTFPNLTVIARARNRHHAHLLMDRGVTGVVRETLHSSLRLSEVALMELGVSAAEARHATELFEAYDARSLIESQAIYEDETQLIQSVQQAAEELESLFEADMRERAVEQGYVKPAPKRAAGG